MWRLVIVGAVYVIFSPASSDFDELSYITPCVLVATVATIAIQDGWSYMVRLVPRLARTASLNPRTASNTSSALIVVTFQQSNILVSPTTLPGCEAR